MDWWPKKGLRITSIHPPALTYEYIMYSDGCYETGLGRSHGRDEPSAITVCGNP